MRTYLFYDIETTGLSKSFDQVLQFAAIRTDLNFQEIERYELKIKLNTIGKLIKNLYLSIMEQNIVDSLQKSISELELYVVMNSTGQFFRAKGYGGYGSTWVNDIKKAKTYGKIGQARARVTWFFNTYPEYSPPAILKLSVNSFEILNELDRVLKVQKTKIQKEAERKAKQAKSNLEYAQRNLEKAKQELEQAKLKNN